ncbi:hypothetical protein SLA2020_197730 [Shorea laevis]
MNNSKGPPATFSLVTAIKHNNTTSKVKKSQSPSEKMMRQGFTRENPISLSPVKEEDRIVLKVQRPKEVDVYYRVGRETPLQLLMLHYSEFMGFVFDELKFLYDGKNVKPENTAQEFKMEDEDIIDAMSDMLGGGCLCFFCLRISCPVFLYSQIS